MTVREKMARAICVRNTGNDRSWALYLDDADAALSVLTNPDEETVVRLAKAMRRKMVCVPGIPNEYVVRAILAALTEEV